jgi:GrpB-like predicted nucleotidyltransferase (UPF0157 family)
LDDATSARLAIDEAVTLVPYDRAWPKMFETERRRIQQLCPQIVSIEHIGSTAAPGLAAKPVIDLMAAVASMEIADEIAALLCEHGYITSAEFNRTLGNPRWLMRHADGHRTHHLHLVLDGSEHLQQCIRFRDALRSDDKLAQRYTAHKYALAGALGQDREAYGDAKGAFIAAALASA